MEGKAEINPITKNYYAKWPSYSQFNDPGAYLVPIIVTLYEYRVTIIGAPVRLLFCMLWVAITRA